MIVGLVASLVLAFFARPSAVYAATTPPAPSGPYQVITIDATDRSLTVREMRQLAERATGQSLPLPNRAWCVEATSGQPTPAQLAAIAAGQDVPGVRVLRTVDRLEPATTVGDLVGNDPGTAHSIWFLIIWIIIFIIRTINDD